MILGIEVEQLPDRIGGGELGDVANDEDSSLVQNRIIQVGRGLVGRPCLERRISCRDLRLTLRIRALLAQVTRRTMSAMNREPLT